MRALHGYADAVDRADMDGLLAHFDENAKWNFSPSAMVQGHAALREFFEERWGVFANSSHHVEPAVLSSGIGAECVGSIAYVQAKHALKDGSSYTVWGRYVDQLRLTDERAFFLERTVLVHAHEGTDRVYTMLERESHPL